MKNKPFIFLGITSLLLFLTAAFSVLDIPFFWLFAVIMVGQIFWLISVFVVLTDDYKTEKTFEDFYEDYPNIEN